MPNKFPHNSNNERSRLRQMILQLRDQLTTEEICQKSSAIIHQLWQFEAVQKAKTIFTYVNFRSEVATTDFIDKCLRHKINICVPLTITKPPHLIAYQLTDPEKQLRCGYCDIPEPDPEKAGIVSPETIDIVILPGSVFDQNGGRLGYGGGYYDRFLQNDAPNALRIGIAFDLQVKEHLPLLDHDQALHHLVTESRTLNFKITSKQ